MLRHLFLAVFLVLTSATAQAETPPQTAIFAGGCFWCMEAEFEGIDGVSAVVSGYTGGTAETATYDQVSTGTTGHVESVEVTFDPSKVGYEKLLDIFWSNVDPTDAEGQFCDKGSQYAAGVFYNSDAQKLAAETSLKKIEKKFGKVASFVRPAQKFYPAETHHQDYYRNNELRYKLYKKGCGRAERLDDLQKAAP